MIYEHLKERNIHLEPIPEFYEYIKYQFDEESPYQDIVFVLEKYLIEHKDKTIIDILCQINFRQMELIDNLMKIDEDVSADFITETIVFQELFIVKNHIKNITYWLYEGKTMPDDFKAELERLADYVPRE